MFIFKVMKKAVEKIKTYSYRSLYNNKIEQLPPGIFSNLSLNFFGFFVAYKQEYNSSMRKQLTNKNLYGFITYAASIQGK